MLEEIFQTALGRVCLPQIQFCLHLTNSDKKLESLFLSTLYDRCAPSILIGTLVLRNSKILVFFVLEEPIHMAFVIFCSVLIQICFQIAQLNLQGTSERFCVT